MVARSEFYAVENINVHDLLLDSSNPRIRHGVDQHDCMARIARDRVGFLNLLQDICENGISPEHIVISKNKNDKWVVRDGNRRVTVLKLLDRPELCLPDESLYKLVDKISKQDHPNRPGSTIDCLASDNEKAILNYLKRKHTGENSGIGQVNWNALLIALYNLQTNNVDQNRRAAQIVIWVEERNLNVPDDFPITSLTRLLSEKTLRNLGFEVIDDKISPCIPDHQAYALAARVVSDISAGKVHVKRDGTVGSIYSVEDAENYSADVRRELGPSMGSSSAESEGQSPPAGQAQASPEGGGSGSSGQGSNPGGGSGNPGNSQPTNPTTRPIGNTGAKAPWDRPCLFGARKRSGPGFGVPDEETKVITIIDEIRKLVPKDNPLATAMLLRALFEFSVMHYKGAHGLKEKGSLHSNIAGCADHMESNGLINKSQYDAIKRHTRDEHGLLHIKTIQAYIHDPNAHPNAQTINTMWDDIGCFVKACWA